MSTLIAAFAAITLHRRSPLDLPESRHLLALTLGVYAVVALIALRLDDASRGDVVAAAADVALFLGVVWVVLHVMERSARFLQTATALVGTGALLSAVSLPLILWLRDATAAGSGAGAPGFLYLLLYLWSIDVGGYVVAKALARPYILGVSIVVVYELTSQVMREALFPAAV